MPKLDKKTQKATEAAEEWGDGFALLPDGRYAGRLAKVEVRDGRNYDYWSWEFNHLHDEDGKEHPGRLWHNTSMSPNALGNLKKTFSAMGYSLDSDTDEMVGDWVTLTVGTEIQAQGKRAGEKRNVVRGLAELNEDEFDFDPDEIPEDAPAVGGPATGGSENEF